MSFSSSLPSPVRAGDFEPSMLPRPSQAGMTVAGSPVDVQGEVNDLFDAGANAVEEMLAAFPHDALVSVSVNGHANPGHDKAPGWANDCVSVNISVWRYPSEETPEPTPEDAP